MSNKLRMEANAEDIGAMLDLGLSLQREGNFMEAMEWWEKAANLGEFDAPRNRKFYVKVL